MPNYTEPSIVVLRRLSVVTVVFLCQITVFLQQNTTTSLLELYLMIQFNANCVHTAAATVAANKEVADGPIGPM